MLTTLVSGCTGDDGCAGQSYHADLTEKGAASPIDALNAWLAAPEGFDPGQLPPDDGWIVQGAEREDAAEVVMRNDTGAGWWVQAVRTDDGGYVIDEATDDWASCADELS